MSKGACVAIGLSLIALVAMPATATISLNYAGAFKCGFTAINGGDIAYYPAGNGGAGSLFISEGSSDTRKELSETTIPTLVVTNDPANLNVATTLNQWDESRTMAGLGYASDGKLYFSKAAANQGITIGSVNTDGTGLTSTDLSWWGVDSGANYDVIDNSLVSGYDKILLTQDNSVHDPMLWAYNSSTSAKTKILKYDAAHLRTGYVSSDAFFGAALVPDGSDAVLILAGTTNNENTLWFYHASDIVNAANLYDPQPYATLSIQDKIFAPSNGYQHTIYGLAYDSANNMLYATEGAYSEPDYVQAWSVVVPEPATLALLLCGGLALYRRRRA